MYVTKHAVLSPMEDICYLYQIVYVLFIERAGVLYRLTTILQAGSNPAALL